MISEAHHIDKVTINMLTFGQVFLFSFFFLGGTVELEQLQMPIITPTVTSEMHNFKYDAAVKILMAGPE